MGSSLAVPAGRPLVHQPKLSEVAPSHHTLGLSLAQSPGAVNRVLSLQLTAFWQNHSNTIVGVGAAAACYGLWRALIRTSQVRCPGACICCLLPPACCCCSSACSSVCRLLPAGRHAAANACAQPCPPCCVRLPCPPQLFVDHSDALAASGLLALAASSVAGGYLFLRRRYTIDPAGVYRLAMYRLNTHPGLLEASAGAVVVGAE